MATRKMRARPWRDYNKYMDMYFADRDKLAKRRWPNSGFDQEFGLGGLLWLTDTDVFLRKHCTYCRRQHVRARRVPDRDGQQVQGQRVTYRFISGTFADAGRTMNGRPGLGYNKNERLWLS